ncbi:MAG: hypothetical protein GX558_00455 [Clostridiales bacterium]|nr:hypothetical protein [Clostridiales bacterium]
MSINEAFERVIPYTHTTGTSEAITVAEVGRGHDFRLTVTTPDKAASRVSVYLEAPVLDALIDALLDLKDACDKRQHHGRPIL